MKRQTAPRWKASALQQMVEAIKENPVIGIAKIGGIPGPQMQMMRHDLRKDLRIQVVKNNLLTLALRDAAKEKPGLDALVPSIEGQSALITSKISAFKLYKMLSDAKTKAPAKGGEIAPDDLEVKAGDTPFKPGPIVGELQRAGIPAAIEEGKVVIKKDKLLVKAGEEIPKPVAEALTKLEIYPLTVGMDLLAAYEAGHVFKRDLLEIDQEVVMGQLGTAAGRALSLALCITYPTKQTVRPLIFKAHASALALALATSTMTKGSAPLLLSRARAQMLALAVRAPEALDDELRTRLGLPTAGDKDAPSRSG
ncbi:MAG: 50S ribosomal protein L10 [Candidatus Thermoplasmatota archaeon]